MDKKKWLLRTRNQRSVIKWGEMSWKSKLQGYEYEHKTMNKNLVFDLTMAFIEFNGLCNANAVKMNSNFQQCKTLNILWKQWAS